jgi:vacuolar-type H+-ATPase subunit C/Vma6
MAVPVAAISVLGGMSTFNMAHGFVEALVRGMRSSFLLDADYQHLTQCENLEVISMSFIMGLYYCHPSL